MTIRKFILVATFCISLLTCMTFFRQPVNAQSKEINLKLSVDRPSVYVTFEKRFYRPALRKDEKGLGILLRLHNNLRASIRFCAFGISNGEQMTFYSDVGEIGVNYEVDREIVVSSSGTPSITTSKKEIVRALPVGYPLGGVCHYFELASGKSLDFSVPTEHLTQGLLIKIPFIYQWENESEERPFHFISFKSSDLPKLSSDNEILK